MAENPFLTELDRIPFIQKSVDSLNGFGWALLFFALALIASFLSFASGSHCFWLRATSVTPPVQSKIVLMGYWGEMNAGPYYVLIVPILIFLYCRFVISLNSAFSSLELSGVIRSRTDENWHAMLGRSNKTLFSKVLLIGVLFSSLLVIGAESLSLIQTKNRLDEKYSESMVMGYVQSPYFEEWAARLRSSEKLRTEIPALRSLGESLIEPMPQERGYSSIYFVAFLVIALFLQTAMVLVSLWIGMKILYFFWVTWCLLRKANTEDKDAVIKFLPNFTDEKRRYGLCEIDAIYHQVLWILIFVSIGLVSNISNNYSKGTFHESFEGADWLSLSGQILIFVSPLLVFVVFVFLPLLVFRNSMERARSGELNSLNRRIREAYDRLSSYEKEREESLNPREGRKLTRKRIREITEQMEEMEAVLSSLRAKKNLVNEQTTYPSGDKMFLTQIVLSTVLLVLIPLTFYANLAAENVKNSPLGTIVGGVIGSVDLSKELLKATCGCK